MLKNTSNFSWGDKLYVYSLFLGPCVCVILYLPVVVSKLLELQCTDMHNFIDKMSNGNGLQGLTCWAASFWNLLVYEHVYNLGNHLVIQSRMSRTSTFGLACTEYRLVPCSPACDLRTCTLGLTYIKPQSSLHSVPFTDISLFRDGNNPGKPYCTVLLSFAPAFLGYDRYIHNVQSHLCSCLQWSSTLQKPVELNRGSFAV